MRNTCASVGCKTLRGQAIVMWMCEGEGCRRHPYTNYNTKALMPCFFAASSHENLRLRCCIPPTGRRIPPKICRRPRQAFIANNRCCDHNICSVVWSTAEPNPWLAAASFARPAALLQPISMAASDRMISPYSSSSSATTNSRFMPGRSTSMGWRHEWGRKGCKAARSAPGSRVVNTYRRHVAAARPHRWPPPVLWSPQDP